MTQKILALFAHPDDEAFGSGGTLAHYAEQGVHITLVCATRGEVGGISDPSLATPESLPQVREEELRCAAKSLGIKELIFLDYRDSGMAGTAENQHPDAFINIPAEEIVPRLVGIIRRLQPQVLITFEPYGGYGHPDHIAIHHHSVAAFHAAAEPAQYPELGAAWQAERLFYTVIARSFFIEMRDRMAARGLDTSIFERFEEDGEGWRDEELHVRLDVSHTIEAKWNALECHRTQFGEDNLFRKLPTEVMKQMMSRESFAQAWPEVAQGVELAGLFAP